MLEARQVPSFFQEGESPVSLALTSQSLRAVASSRDSGEDEAGFRLTKYSPVCPSTSGETAR